MSDYGTPTSTRVTRNAKPVDYRQTHVVNAPSTFTQPTQRTYTPAVPSRLRPPVPTQPPYASPSNYPSTSHVPSSNYPSASHNMTPEPISYPTGPYPLAALIPGSSARSTRSRRPLTQANFSTYDSRMKTGITTLIQPINITGGPNPAFASITGAGTGSSTPIITEGRRRTRVVNYAEDDAYEGIDEDDGDAGGTRYSRRTAQLQRRDTDSNRDVQAGWSWLGERPPAERITASRIHPTTLPFVAVGEDELDREAYKPVLLAPIRIELDTETHRIRDCFTWNVNERLITPYEFAVVLCKDLRINTESYAEPIATAILSQCEEYAPLLNIDVMDDADAEAIVEEGEDADVVSTSLEKGSRSRATSAGISTPGAQTPLAGASTPLPDAGLDTPMEEKSSLNLQEGDVRGVKRVRFNRPGDVDVVKDAEGEIKEAGAAPKESEAEESDCRVIINLDVQISTFNLRDRIEWDLSSTLTPEAFTASYCTELGLTGEAKPIIAHAIHEEILKHKKDAYESGLYGPGAIQYESRKDAPKQLKGVWRDYWEREEFGPVMVPLTAELMQQSEAERSREARRMRRDARR